MLIKNLITSLPAHPDRVWNKRKLSDIDKIIIHQELGESSIEAVNRYHISASEQNHISPRGCPHFCYHFGIRKNGEIVQANELSDITWQCKGQNKSSVGIMLQGNFSGPGYELGTSEPTPEQIKSTEELVEYLQESLQLGDQAVWGHYHFGKRACPGHTMQKWIEEKRLSGLDKPEKIEVEKSIREIQRRLDKLHYNPGPVDGIMGVKTQSAIRKFQADHHLLVDGVVGPQTWKTLLTLSA